MADYTLSSYKEALNSYDAKVESLKDCCSKEIEDLAKLFDKTQKQVENDPFLSLSERSRMLRKRQEGFDKLKVEREAQLKSDLDVEIKNKEDFISENGGFDYHCFTVLNEISKTKEERLGDVRQELIQKKEELARLQAEIEGKEQEADDLQGALEFIQSGTLHETFFELDVIPRVKKVELELKDLIKDHKDNYGISQDFIGRIIRYLTKECKRQKGFVNYEGGKLKLSFDTVENRTKGESARLKDKLFSILRDGGFVISKMEVKKSNQKNENVKAPTFKMSSIPVSTSVRETVLNSQLKGRLSLLEKYDIQGRMEIFKQLSFSFENESAFIKQVETARSEGVDVLEDIDKWLNSYLVKAGGIEPRTSDDKKAYFKISLSCRNRNPRILMKMDPDEGMKIICIAPHVDYDNILKGQTKNYYQTWKGNWGKRGKQGRKTGRA